MTSELECRRYGSSMNSCRSRREATGWTSPIRATRPHAICRPPSTSSRRSGATSAPSSCRRRATPTCSPTSGSLESPAAPGRRDGGRRAGHARLQQLPRPDRRRARHAGRARRARAVRHRADRLAAAQRHDPAPPRARARARRVDGHRGGDRLHHRPPGQRGHARHAAGARRHRDRRLRRPRLDPRRLPALAGEAAPVPPQPAREAREDARPRATPTAAASSSSSTASSRWRATSPRCPRSSSCARRTARG